jgi:hypothetical protein
VEQLDDKNKDRCGFFLSLFSFVLFAFKVYQCWRAQDVTTSFNTSEAQPKGTAPNQQTEKDFSGLDLRDHSIPKIDLTGANFRAATLKRCDFSGRDLSYADFTGADLYRANFSGAKLYATVFREADLTRANFTNAQLYGFKIYETDVTRTIFDTIVYEERIAKTSEDFEMASDIYIMIKRALKDYGNIGLAAQYYYRQRVCQRRAKHNRISRFLEYLFLDSLIGYGEKPIRSVYWAFILIFLFAFVFILLPHFGMGSVIDVSSNTRLILSSIRHLMLALEISITAFVGADMVNWDLNGAARSIASLEALLGTIMLAIILIGFSRKIVRD